MLKPVDKAQIAQSLFLDPVNEAVSIARRYQEGRGLRAYVRDRMALIAPMVVLMAVTSLACAAATVLYLGGTRSFFVLLAIFLVPIVLAGSAFVQAYIYASWLEGRALQKALHRRPVITGPISARLQKAGIDLGRGPAVRWVHEGLLIDLWYVMWC